MSFKNLVKSFYFVFFFFTLEIYIRRFSSSYISRHWTYFDVRRLRVFSLLRLQSTTTHIPEAFRDSRLGFSWFLKKWGFFVCLFLIHFFFRFGRYAGMREKSGCWDRTDLKCVTISSKLSWQPMWCEENGVMRSLLGPELERVIFTCWYCCWSFLQKYEWCILELFKKMLLFKTKQNQVKPEYGTLLKIYLRVKWITKISGRKVRQTQHDRILIFKFQSFF